MIYEIKRQIQTTRKIFHEVPCRIMEAAIVDGKPVIVERNGVKIEVEEVTDIGYEFVEEFDVPPQVDGEPSPVPIGARIAELTFENGGVFVAFEKE